MNVLCVTVRSGHCRLGKDAAGDRCRHVSGILPQCEAAIGKRNEKEIPTVKSNVATVDVDVADLTTS